MIIDFLIGNSKQILKDQQAADAGLAQKADAAKSQADALVAKGDALPGQQPAVDDKWFKK